MLKVRQPFTRAPPDSRISRANQHSPRRSGNDVIDLIEALLHRTMIRYRPIGRLLLTSNRHIRSVR
jgi:hypothetical protein